MKKNFAKGLTACFFVVVVFILCFSSVLANNTTSTNAAKKANLTPEQIITTKVQALTEQLLQTNNAVPSSKSLSTQTVAVKNKVLLQLVEERKVLMKQLMKDNPTLFNSLALNDKTRLALPASVQKEVEQTATITGKTETVYVDDFTNEKNSHFNYSIRTSNGQKYAFYPSSQVSLASGVGVKITGYVLDSQISAQVSKSTIVKVSEPPVSSIGDQKTLVILVKGSPSEVEPFTPAQAKDLVFNSQFQKFMKEQSYNQVSFSGDVVGWFAAGEPDMNCYNGSASFLTPAQLATVANTYHVDFANYGRVVYLVDNAGGGCSAVGKSITTVNGVDYNFSQTHVGLSSYAQPSGWGAQPFNWTNLDYVLSHELGHALGVVHANGWDCGADTLYGDCQHVEYGNYFDTMGTLSYSLDYNLLYKEILGWIPTNRVLSIDHSGTYVINPLESSSGIAGAKININTPNGVISPYYLEFRRPIGFDVNLATSSLAKNNGLFINAINTDNYNYFPRLLDAHPTTADWWIDLQEQATLDSGGVFSDPNQGITIDSVNQTSTSTLSFRVAIANLPCVFKAPGVSVTFDGSDGISSSGYGWLSTQIINYDSNACNSSVFKVNYVLPSGWTVDANQSEDPLAPNKGMNTFGSFSPNLAASGAYTVGVEVTNLQSGLKTVKQIPVTVTPALTITSITPVAGPVNTSVLIEGSGFSDWNNTVGINGQSGSVNTQYVSSVKGGTEISYVIPNLVTTCDGNGCYSTSTPLGAYVLYVGGRGANANIDFTVATGTIAIPAAKIMSTPTLALSYDPSGKESTLTATFQMSIDAVSDDIYIPQNPFYINLIDASGNSIGARSNRTITNVTGSPLVTTVIDGIQYYIIPDGTTANFNVTFVAKPAELFSGWYSAKIYGNWMPNIQQLLKISNENINSSNSVAIIGETSPYITSVSQNLDGLVSIRGERFSTSTNIITVGTQEFSAGSLNGTEITFKPYGVQTGGYYLFVTNKSMGSEAGLSNGFYAQINAVQPPIATYTVTYDGNGNTYGSVPVDPNTYQAGSPVVVLSNTNLLRSGYYNFSGWNTQADGSGTNYYGPNKTFTMGSANVVLYANWVYKPIVINCSSFTYSDWSVCATGTQVRTVLTQSPKYCTGGSPVITQSCTPPPPVPVNGVCGDAKRTYTTAETSFTGSFCSSGTETIGDSYSGVPVSSNAPVFPPAGSSVQWHCNGSNGGTSQDCIARRAPPVCTDFTYSAWPACVNGTQTRTVVSNLPSGCSGGTATPVLTQSCISAPVAPTVTLTADPAVITSSSLITISWSSTNATSCVGSGTAYISGSRPVSGSIVTGIIGATKNLSMTCTGPGGSATANATITYAPTCTSFTYSDWSTCVGNTQTRTVASSSPTSCTGGTPTLTQSCTTPAIASYIMKIVVGNDSAGNPMGTIQKSPDKPTYNSGDSVTVNAVPSANYKFLSWKGAITGSANPQTITMTSDKTVAANFGSANNYLTISAVNGTVTKSPDSPVYNYGDTVTLTAVPASGYTFGSWSGTGVIGTDITTTVWMNGDRNVTANFTPAAPTSTTTSSLSGNQNYATAAVGWDTFLKLLQALR